MKELGPTKTPGFPLKSISNDTAFTCSVSTSIGLTGSSCGTVNTLDDSGRGLSKAKVDHLQHQVVVAEAIKE